MIKKVAMVLIFKEQHIDTIEYIQPQRQNPEGHPTQIWEIEKVPASMGRSRDDSLEAVATYLHLL